MKPGVILPATKPAARRVEHPGTGSAKQLAGTGGLLEAALTRQNLQRAWKRVKANKGAAGVDGLDIEQTARVLQTRWPEIRQALVQRSYRLSPVCKVMITKPDARQRMCIRPIRADHPPTQGGEICTGQSGENSTGVDSGRVSVNWMIAVARFQNWVIGKGHDHSSQISLQGQTVLPFGFALEVPLELAGAFNRPQG